jgi:hypothetical protein
LETGSLTVELTPLDSSGNLAICNLVISARASAAPSALQNYPITKLPKLFHFLMRRMLPATAAELLHLQPVRQSFAVFGRRIIPLFALTTLQRNDLSGHCSLPKIVTE